MTIASYPINRSVHSGEQITAMDFRPLKSGQGERIELVVRLHKTASSLHLRISLGGRVAGLTAAGNLFTYGEGVAEGAPAPERFFPLTLSLDITEAARPLVGVPRVEVYLEIIDGRGRNVTKESVFIEGIELQIVDEA